MKKKFLYPLTKIPRIQKVKNNREFLKIREMNEIQVESNKVSKDLYSEGVKVRQRNFFYISTSSICYLGFDVKET